MKLAIGLLVLSLAVRANARGADSTVIPAIANLAGVRVGQDTMEQLERRFGPAQVINVGGHSQGDRSWLSKQTGCGVFTHGSYCDDRGAPVIDLLSVSFTTIEGRPRPNADIPRRNLLFMHAVSVGMSRAEVLRRLRDKLPPPEINAESLTWKAKGNYRFNAMKHYQFTKWTAQLLFKQGWLTNIVVRAE